MQTSSADPELLKGFEAQFKVRVPHLENGRIVNPTPLVDVTGDLLECARNEYGLSLRAGDSRVFAKFESKIHGGSVKVRPALRIIEDAIATGKLTRGQTIFEATSGNFGLALGNLSRLGLGVVALVSRKLQPGVLEQLRRDGVKLVNLDVDICPAPGMPGDANLLMAKGTAAGVGQQLEELGFSIGRFEAVRGEAEELLARQDVIGLAKLLARAYDGFCPEQYDNSLNVEVHEEVTGPEIAQQLTQEGVSPGDAVVVCAFGTGGTATGVSRFAMTKFGKQVVRVVFPLTGQEVAGIRTKDTAKGLRFYQPHAYLGEHEVDFEETRKLFSFFNDRGYDVGESGALSLFACMQMLNFGVGKMMVAMVADGSSKYVVQPREARKERRDQVTLRQAVSSIKDYGGVVWAHNMFVPTEEGIKVIASSLGCLESEVKVAQTRDVQAILNGGNPSEGFEGILPSDGKPVLVVCMAGNTSLMLAKVLERRGVVAESLIGGITGLPESRTRQPFELVRMGRS